jgi:RNA-binding protein
VFNFKDKETVKELNGSQRKYLRGLAHDIKPSAFVGQKGLTDALVSEVSEALDACELIKVKFVDFKEKKVKTALAQEIETATSSILAGLIGHVAIYYREHRETEKRFIRIPK